MTRVGEERSEKRERIAPLWLYLLVSLLCINAAVHFGSLFFLNEGGITDDSPYALRSHGKIIRRLTEREYFQHKAYEERMISASFAFGYGCLLIIAINQGQSRKNNSP